MDGLDGDKSCDVVVDGLNNAYGLGLLFGEEEEAEGDCWD